MEIILFVVIVYLLAKTSSLQAQISSLSKKIKPENSTEILAYAKPAETVMPINLQQQLASIPTSAQDKPVHTSSMEFDVFAWFKENWILKLGVILMVMGFGWFVSYAFIHNWIGPSGRIALGFAFGLLVMLGGIFRIKKSPSQGEIFTVFGELIILITVVASRFVYDFFNPTIALGIVFVTSMFVMISAVVKDRINLAVIGVISASLAPTLVNSITDDVVNRFLYIFIVSISAVSVMFYKKWKEVGATAIITVLCYSLYYGSFGDLGSSKEIVLFLAFLLSLFFFVVSISSLIKFEEKVDENDSVIALVNSILILLWTYAHVSEPKQSFVLTLWIIIFAIGSLIVFKYARKIKFFYIYSAISVVYLALVTAMELDGTALVFAYIFESALVSILGYIATSRIDVGEKLSLLMIGPAILTLESFVSNKWYNSFLHEDFAVILCMGLSLFAVGLFFFMTNKENYPDEKTGMEFRPYSYMMIFGSFYLFVLIWLSTNAVLEYALAVMASLAVYTIVGIISYFFGKRNNRIVYRYYGSVLLLLVVARLILVDVWEMELAVRVVTFILVGLLFVSTSFISSDKKTSE